MSSDTPCEAPPRTGRLAPSPTGYLHLGHARSFLIAWWRARSIGGRLLMRMGDLDASRARPEFEAAALRDLEWLGLDWDGPVVRQSERSAGYYAALESLSKQGLLYACTCTRRELELAAGAPQAGDDTLAYPGTCRGRYASAQAAEDESGRAAALRFQVQAGRVEFRDGLAGPQSFEVAREVGDFPVCQRDGTPAYQLAVVVDDAAQGVTEVVRGDDLLSSTARQILLQRALGLDPPAWFHLPLVHDAGGRRLAKRSDDLSLASLRAAGVDPRRIVAWVARSAGMEVDPGLRAEDCLPHFDLDRLPGTGIRLGEEFSGP
jgi:glutamyl-tRNA synthetase